MSAVHRLLSSFSRAWLLGAALAVVMLAAATAAAIPAAAGTRSAAPAGTRAARPAGMPAVPASFGPGPPVNAGLSGVSCLSASFCMAVGGYTGTLGGSRPLSEEWNGSRWRVLPSPASGGTSQVSCTRVTFCMAVGTGPQIWNGLSWQALRTGGGVNGQVAILGCGPACGVEMSWRPQLRTGRGDHSRLTRRHSPDALPAAGMARRDV